MNVIIVSNRKTFDKKKKKDKKYLKKDKRRKLNRKKFFNKHDKARPLVIYRLRSIDLVQFYISSLEVKNSIPKSRVSNHRGIQPSS